jgi:hypothetical protein
VRAWCRAHPALVGAAAFAIPFLVALVSIARHAWYPVLDMAMTEFRVRDVGTAHTPLVGLPGRIGRFPDQGSHPGPLSFYAVAPVYRLVGSTAHGMEFGTVLLSMLAIVTALWLARRRGGASMTLAVTAMVAVVVWRYGPSLLTQPWNPYLPVLPWIVVLLAAWSVLDRDPVAWLPFVVFGSLAAQTHIPSVGLVGGLGAHMLAMTAWRAVREPATRRRALGWCAGSIAVLVVLWLPPLADQVAGHRNISMIIDYFRNPPEAAVGFGTGLRVLLGHFDLLHSLGQGSFSRLVVAGTDASTGSVVIGALVLGAWVVSAVVAVRRRLTRIVPLHAVVATAIGLGVLSLSRIFGTVWYYLSLWMVGTVALAILAIVWTAYAVLRERGVGGAGLAVWGRRATVAVAAVALVAFTVECATFEPPEASLSDPLGVLVQRTDRALDRGVGGATRADRFVVTWNDAHYIGSQGYGLVNELERRGWTVGVPDTWRIPVTRQRVIPDDRATRELRFASGRYLTELRASGEPGVTVLARFYPRTPAERVQYAADRRALIASLRARGLDDRVAQVDETLFTVSLEPTLTAREKVLVARMLRLGQPVGVLLVPIGYRR